jgi:hypothetical protein
VADKPDNPGWFTTQLRVRQETHDYLVAQARRSGISITQAAGAILEHACRQGWEIGPVVVVHQPSAEMTGTPRPVTPVTGSLPAGL